MEEYNGYLVYEPGTKVRLVTKRKPDGQCVTLTELMTGYLGKIVTIDSVYTEKYGYPFPVYSVKECCWYWDPSLIEGIAFNICSEEDEELGDISFGKYFSGFAVKV